MTDDILYSPVRSLDDQLREIVRRVAQNPTDPDVREKASDDIVDLFRRHGITNTDEMIDGVHRALNDIDDDVFDIPYAMGRGPIAVARILFPPYVWVSAISYFHVANRDLRSGPDRVC